MPKMRLSTPRLAAVIAAITALAIAAVVTVQSAVAWNITVLPAGAALSCKLPVSALSNDHTTGFIVLGGGRATFQRVQSSGTTYIPALGIWADALPQMVAPDGRSYVSQSYNGGRTTIALIDAKGTHKLLSTSAAVNVFAYTSEGILVGDMSARAGATGPPTELPLKVLDPNTGTLQALPFASMQLPRSTDLSAGYIRASNAIWLMVRDSAHAGTTVSRYDLTNGSTTEWFTAADAHGFAEVVGADSQGAPIIQIAESDIYHTDPASRQGIRIQTLLVASPHHAVVLNEGRAGDSGVASALSPLSTTDGDSVWLATNDGAIWLYQPASGLQQVAKITTSIFGSPGVAISGPCT